MSVEFDRQKINWEEARDRFKKDRSEGGSRELPPEDNYLAKVVHVSLEKGSGKGTLYFRVEFRIVCSLTKRDAGDADATALANEPVWDNFMLEGPGVFRSRMLEAAVGCDEDDELDEFAAKLEDAHVRITTAIEKSEGYADKAIVKKVVAPTNEDTSFATSNPPVAKEDDFDRF